MATHKADLRIGIKYDVDRSSIEQIKSSLASLQVAATIQKDKGSLSKELENAAIAAKKLDAILDNSWNAKLGQLNLDKVKNGINQTYGSVQQLKAAFVASGTAGKDTYNEFAKSILRTNVQVKQTNKLLDDMAKTFQNTIRFGISSRVFNNMTNSLQQAFEYTKALDKSLNDIRIVTDKSADQMERFAIQANKVAGALGRGTKDYTNAALIYYQQGLSDAEANARTEATLKAANVTGQSAQDVSEQLTAVWNGYKVNASEAELYVDKLAAVAASTAADLEELSTGMSKVASAANLMGVDVDQLNAQLATIVSVTRQAPESVGNALKTIYARMGDIKAGLDDETTLGNYTSKMAALGVNVLDARGNLRDMGEVIEEIGGKWTTLTREQQINLSQTMAGVRQYNNLLSLFDNWDQYTDALETSRDAAGTLQHQQDIYMESTAAHLQQLRTEAEKTYDILFDTDTVNGFTDALRGALGVFNTFLQGFGSGGNAINFFGTTLTSVFSKQIGGAIGQTIQNADSERSNKIAAQYKTEVADAQAAGLGAKASGLNAEGDIAVRTSKIQDYLNPDEYNFLVQEQKKIGELTEELEAFKIAKEKAFDFGINQEDNVLALQEIETELGKAGERAETASAQIESMNDAIEEYNRKVMSGAGKTKEGQAELEALQRQIEMDSGYKKFNKKTFKGLESNAKEGFDVISKDEQAKILERQQKTYKENIKDINALKEGQKAIQAEEEGIISNKETELKLENQKVDALEKEKQLQAEISGAVKAASLTLSTIVSLTGLIKTWANDNLSFWEKVKSTLAVIAVQSIQILSNAGELGKSFKSLGEFFKGIMAGFAGRTAAWEAETAAIKKQNIELDKNNAKKVVGNNVTNSKGGDAVKEGVKGAVKKKAIKEGRKKVAEGSIGAGEGLAGLGASLGAALPYILVAVAAIAATTAVIYGIYKKFDIKGQINDEIEKTKKNLEKVKSEYSELTTNLNAYKDARKNIDNLTEGTVEFYDAIMKANEEAQKLIDSLDLMYGRDYTIGKNGLIEISEDQRSSIQFAKQQEIYRAQVANLDAQIKMSRYAQGEIVKNFTKDVNKNNTKTNSLINETQGRAILANTGENKNGIIQNSIGELGIKESINSLNRTNQLNNNLTNELVQSNQESVEQEKNIVDMTKSINAYMPQLKREQANERALELQKQVAIIQGYGSKSQVEYFNTLSSRQQEAIATLSKNQTSKAEHQYNIVGHEGFWGAVENLGEEYVKGWGNWFTKAGDMFTDPLGYLESRISGPGFGATTSGVKGIEKTVKEENERKYLREQYLINTSNGQYTEEKLRAMEKTDPKKYKELVKGVDLTTAQEAYNNNYYKTEDVLQGIIESTKKTQEELQKQGFNETSVKYIMDTILGAKAGTLQKEDVEKLTQEERIAAREQIGEQVFKGAEPINNELVTTPSGEVIVFDDALKELYVDIDENVKSIQRLKEEMIDYNAAMTSAAQELGTTEAALKAYDTAMTNAEGTTQTFSKETANAAIQEYKFNKAYNEGRKVFEDNEEAFNDYAKALKKGKKVSYDIADAVGEILTKLEEMGLVIHSSNLKDDNVLTNIDKLLKGTQEEAEEAYEALYDLSRLNTLADFFNIDLNKEENAEQVQTLKNIIKGIDDTKPGENLADQYAEQLGKMIEDTNASVQEIDKLAQQLGVEIPVTYKAPEQFGVVDQQFSTGAQSILHQYDGEMPDPSGGKKEDGSAATIPVHYQWVETIQDKTEHFLHPDTTNFKVSTNKTNLKGSKNYAASKGKSGSSSKPDKMDPLKTEVDRYHKVNTQITKVDNNLKKLQSRQEHIVGKNWLDNLTSQWNELNTQIGNYNEKLRIANEEQNELANSLANKGVQFNADGTIANYGESIKAQEAYVNSLINKYNSMSKEKQETYKETVENAKKEFEEFQKNIDRYDELVSDFIPDLKQSIQDAIDKQIDLSVQKFNKEVEITLDMSQATRDWNEWAKRAIQGFDPEDIFGNAQARLKDFDTYFNGKNNGEVQVQTRHLEDLLNQLKLMDQSDANIYGHHRAEALENLKDYYTQLMQSITDVIELQDELHQDVLDEMDEVQDKFSKQIESYEYLRELINHDMKVIELTLGDEAYGEMAKFYEAQQNNYEKQLDFQRQQKDFWYAEMQAAEEGSKEWESAKEKWMSAVNEYNSILEEGLENAAKKFENAINDVFQKLNNSLTGGMGLNYVETQWDLINKNADRYLDTINATYAIRELEKKYTDSINKSDNVVVQQRLKKVMDEQLGNMKERERITQYDVDRANKLYELELARIALEEAQQNKSQMRLRRDSQGNYTYQYTADKNAVGEAEDQLQNAYNDLYNFDKERYNTILNDVYTIWNDYQSQMAEAALINDPQQRAEKERLIQEQYNEMMLQAEEDYQVAKYDLQQSFFWDWVELNDMSLENFKNLTDTEKDIIMTEFVPTWKNGISEMAEQFNGPEGFAKVTQDSWYAMKDAEQSYAQDMEKLEIAAGQTYKAIYDGEDDAVEKAEKLVEDNDKLIKKYDEELTAVQNVYNEVKKLRDMYAEAEQAAIKATEAAYKYAHKEDEKQAEAAKQQEIQNNTANTEALTNTNNGTTSSGDGGGAAAGGGGNGAPEAGEVVTYNGGRYYSDSYGGGRSGSKSAGSQVKITIVKNGRPYPIHIATTSGGALGWVRQDQISGYDTGGYTGDWGNSGRLAVLHQKELVLNSDDTRNILSAVDIMRTISLSLGSNVLARLAGAKASGMNGTTGSDILEQQVHIDAQFPNVRDAAEIEEALNSLVNSASQRIGEKRGS